MINEARMYEMLSKIINKLTHEVGMHDTDIKDMLEISQEEIDELNINRGKLN